MRPDEKGYRTTCDREANVCKDVESYIGLCYVKETKCQEDIEDRYPDAERRLNEHGTHYGYYEVKEMCERVRT